MKAKTVLIVAVIVLLAVLVIQNSALIPFRLLFWSAYMPVFIFVIGVFAVGFIIGYLAARLDRRKVAKKDVEPPAPVGRGGIPEKPVPPAGPEKPV
jgi:uncharacterized integral membrane protein